MFKVITQWCRQWLDKLSQGTFYPEFFQKLRSYDKQYPHVLPMWVARGIISLVILLMLSVLIKPAVVRGCTWVLTSAEEDAYMRQRRQVAVEAQSVHLGTMTRRIQTVGKLTANASVPIRVEIHGRIRKIAFVEGSQVKKGDLLIQLEDDDIQAELKQAEAELALRKADYGRAQQLQQNRAGTMKDYDKAQAEMAVSEGRVAAAKSKLSKTVITAPFDGTIGIIHFSEGSYIQANQELVHLVDTTPMKVDFKVPEKFVNDIGPGQMAEVRVQALGDRVFVANIDAVDSRVETENHSIAVKGSIANENGILKAGSFAQVSLIIGEKGDTIVVDESAVDREGNFEFVWVVEKGRVHRQRVITGVREKQKIEVVAGLRSGQVVVTAGQIRLADGMTVNITNMTPEALAAGDKKPSEAAKDDKKAEPQKEAEAGKSSEAKPDEKVVPVEKAAPDEKAVKPEEKKVEPTPKSEEKKAEQDPAQQPQDQPKPNADQAAPAQGS